VSLFTHSLMPITVSVVEDNPGMRQSVAALLNRTRGVSCVGVHRSAEDALKNIPFERPDVALVDINLPGMSGIECVAELKSKLPQLEVLMLTLYEHSDLIFQSLRAGASGYLLKNMPSTDLIQAVQQVHAGGAPMSMSIARRVTDYFRENEAPDGKQESLTSREREVLRMIAKGDRYKEIADSLGISLSTVRTHVHLIYKKLHVHSRTEATITFLKGPRK